MRFFQPVITQRFVTKVDELLDGILVSLEIAFHLIKFEKFEFLIIAFKINFLVSIKFKLERFFLSF